MIVDEIHAVIGTRRGSHLALSLERLEQIAGRPLQRIGLSATQRPVETVARFLVGAESSRGECAVVDEGHRRALDLELEIPQSPLGAVMSHEVWEEYYDRLAELIRTHRTTLVFVNTRRLAERLARHLSERLGEDQVTAHHGSLSKETRIDAEHRLKSGTLKALVATASLELGIDIGYVDLVCQIGSPNRIATLLQRVGRSGHTISGTPKGRLLPVSRDDLVECAALVRSVRRGELDAIVMHDAPLDVLAQQITAEVACRAYGEDELFTTVRRAWPYRALERTSSTPSSRCWRRASRPVAADAPHSSTATKFTACCTHDAAHAWWRSHQEAPSPKWRTIAWSRTRRRRSSARLTKTSRSRAQRAISSSSGMPPGRSLGDGGYGPCRRRTWRSADDSLLARRGAGPKRRAVASRQRPARRGR